MSHPLELLRAKFLMRCGEDLVLLDRADPQAPSEEARRAVHRLAGTAGMFGHEALGRLALAIDDRLHADGRIEPADLDALKAELRGLPAWPQGVGREASL